MKIIATEMILICECSEDDIAMLANYSGIVIEDYHPVRDFSISNHK